MQKRSPVVKFALALAVPLLACSTYYTLERIESASAWTYLAALIAPALLLIGAIGGAAALGADKPKRALLWAAAIATLAPLALLIYVWR
jgi:hypothetical protein